VSSHPFREDLVEELLSGSWRRLVLPGAGRIDKNSYVFCVLTHFHRHLKRREIYAPSLHPLVRPESPAPGRERLSTGQG